MTSLFTNFIVMLANLLFLHTHTIAYGFQHEPVNNRSSSFVLRWLLALICTFHQTFYRVCLTWRIRVSKFLLVEIMTRLI